MRCSWSTMKANASRTRPISAALRCSSRPAGPPRFIRFLPGAQGHDCIVLPKDEQKDALVCLVGHMGQGIVESAVARMAFSRKSGKRIEIAPDFLLRAEDAVSAYGSNVVMCNEGPKYFRTLNLAAGPRRDTVAVDVDYADDATIRSACGEGFPKPKELYRPPRRRGLRAARLREEAAARHRPRHRQGRAIGIRARAVRPIYGPIFASSAPRQRAGGSCRPAPEELGRPASPPVHAARRALGVIWKRRRPPCDRTDSRSAPCSASSRSDTAALRARRGAPGAAMDGC